MHTSAKFSQAGTDVGVQLARLAAVGLTNLLTRRRAWRTDDGPRIIGHHCQRMALLRMAVEIIDARSEGRHVWYKGRTGSEEELQQRHQRNARVVCSWNDRSIGNMSAPGLACHGVPASRACAQNTQNTCRYFP